MTTQHVVIDVVHPGKEQLMGFERTMITYTSPAVAGLAVEEMMKHNHRIGFHEYSNITYLDDVFELYDTDTWKYGVLTRVNLLEYKTMPPFMMMWQSTTLKESKETLAVCKLQPKKYTDPMLMRYNAGLEMWHQA